MAKSQIPNPKNGDGTKLAPAGEALPAAVSHALRAYGRRVRTGRCLAVALGGAAAALLAFLAGVLLDRFVEVRPLLRCVPLAVFSAAALAGLAAAAFEALRRSRPEESLAGEIDARLERARDALRSAVNFLDRLRRREEPGHRFLVDRTVAEADQMARGLRVARLHSFRRPVLLAVTAAGLVLVIVGLAQRPGMPMGLMACRFFDPFGNYPRPSWTRILLLEAPPARFEAGGDLAVAARLEGRIPAQPACTLILQPADLKRPGERLVMQPLPDGTFRARVRNARQDFSFCIEAGDGRTARYDVRVLQPPQIVSMEATYRPPRYSRLPKKTEPVQYREIRALEGTAVSVEFVVDSAVAEASVTIETAKQTGGGGDTAGFGPKAPGGGLTAIEIFLKQEEQRRQKLVGAAGPEMVRKTLPVDWDPVSRRGTFSMMLDESGVLRVNLKGANGVTNRFDPSYKLAVLPDNPPVVSITNLTEDLTIRPDDVLRVSYRVRDDLGISDLTYQARTSQWEEQSWSVPLEEFGAKEAEGEVAIPVVEMAPFDRYTAAGGFQDLTLDFTLEAVDTKGQSTSSRRVQITVLRETYDRDVAEVIEHLGDMAGANADNLARLNSAINSLVVLRDSLGDGDAWGDQQQAKLAQVAAGLRFTTFSGNAWWERRAAFRYSTYPYRAQQAADYLLSRVLCQEKDYSALAELGKEPGRKARLTTAIATLEKQRDFVRAFGEAGQDTVRLLRTDRLGYLVELLRRDLARVGPDVDKDYAQLLAGKQAARASDVAREAKALGLAEDGSPAAEAASSLQAAAAAFDVAALQSAVAALRAALAQKESFAGNRSDALERLRLSWSDAALLAQSVAEGQAGLAKAPLDSVRAAWAQDIVLSSDAALTDEPTMAARALALIRAADGDTNPRGALDLLERARAPAEAYAVLTHANEACEEATALLDGAASGRLKAGNLEVERTWIRLRDVVLVLLDRLDAGGFAEADAALRDGVGKLRGYRALVNRWDFGDVIASADSRAELARLVGDLESLRRQAAASQALSGVDGPALLAEGCGRLAKLFDAERADALRRIAELREREQKEGAAKIVGQEMTRDQPAYWEYGVAKEQVILNYASWYRKLADLSEAQAALNRSISPDGARQHSAMVRYLWWMGNDIAHTFGRYEGPSVVRRHAVGAGAFLTKMKDYPDDLAKASAGFAHLASKPGQPAPEVEALLKTSHNELEVQHETAKVSEFVAALADAAAPKDAPADAQALGRAYGDPITGAFVADRIVIPLRRAEEGLRSPELAPPALQNVLADMAQARRVMESLPERPRNMEESIATLDSFGKAAARSNPPRDGREETAEAVAEFLETLESKVTLPPIQTKMSKRLNAEVGLNGREFGCMERTDRLWQLEIGRQGRCLERERVGILLARSLGQDQAGPLVAFTVQFAHYRVAARKSQGVERESGGTLDVAIPGVEYDRLAMPRYLYDELLKANAEPYPEQFKEQGLRYIQGLLMDAKK